MAVIPDPATEISVVGLRTLAGANYWSRRSVTRLDLAVGAFDYISSADVEGFTDALVSALPGLVEHRCSVGTRGGFVERLRRGTYAPHIAEHVGLELQSLIGHEIGYGRARGGERDGEYIVVMEHRHSLVGREAILAGLRLVQVAFAGKPLDVGPIVEQLKAAARGPDPAPPPRAQTTCAVLGSPAVANALMANLAPYLHRPADSVSLAPRALLEEGLPFARSDLVVILPSQSEDVPERFADSDDIHQIWFAVAETVGSGGFLVYPASEGRLSEIASDVGARSATFGPIGSGTRGEIHVEQGDESLVIAVKGEMQRICAPFSGVPLELQLAVLATSHILERIGK